MDSLGQLIGMNGQSFTDHSLSRGVHMLDFVSSNIQLPEDAVVFEIGCGKGGILSKFFAKGYTVVGCDLCDEEVFRYGRSIGMKLLKGNHNVLKSHGKADLVIFSHVIEHLPDPIGLLKEVRELLKPDGIIFIAVPGVLDPKTSCNYNYASYFIISHLFHYSAKNMSMMLGLAGYETIKSDERVYCLAKKSDQNIMIDASNQPDLIEKRMKETEEFFNRRLLWRKIRRTASKFPEVTMAYKKYLCFKKSYY